MHQVFEELKEFLGRSNLKHSFLPGKGKAGEDARFKALYQDLLDNIPELDDNSLSREELFKIVWKERIKSCEGCLLHKTRNHVVMPDGHFNAPIMVVLEGPGFLEDLSKIPIASSIELRASHCGSCSKVLNCFDSRLIKIGDHWAKGKKKAVVCEPNYVNKVTFPNNMYVRSTGTILDGILIKNFGYRYPRHSWETTTSISPWFITNSVLCRSWNPLNLDDESPSKIPLKECYKWFLFTYFCVKPKVIIALGNIALQTVTGLADANLKKEVQVNKIYNSILGPIVFNSHPARIMRSPNQEVRSALYARLGGTMRIALEKAGLENAIDKTLV